MSTLDVTDYGAKGDGSTDDTTAIQSAIDDASTGDTVYFPATSDYYRVEYSGDNVLLTLDGNVHADDITLKGDGIDSMIKLGSNPSNNYALLRIEHPNNFTVTIRDLVWDGNKSVADSSSEPGHCIQFRETDPSGTGDILVEDCIFQNANTSGFTIQYGGVTINRCTSRWNAHHGGGFYTNSSGEHDPRSVVKNSLFTDNCDVAGYYCFDFSNGKGIAENCVFQNGWGGTKSSEGAKHFTARRIRIQNNDDAIMRNTSSGAGVDFEFEDIVAEGNADVWRMGESGNYTVIDGSEIVATDNSSSGYAQILLEENASLDASNADVYSNRANGTEGLESVSSASSTIDNYYHYQNDDGATDGTSNLTINNQEQRDKTDISGVPTASDVGAWSDTSTTTTDDSTATPTPTPTATDTSFDSWTPQWSSTTDDWSVISDTTFEGDHAMQFANSDSIRTRFAISWDKVGTPSDVEVLDRFRVPSFSSDSSYGYHARVHLRSSGSAGNESGYWLEMETPENGFRLGKYSSGGGATLARFGTPEENTFYYRRFRANGDELKAKVWPASQSEPSSWDVQVTDTDHGSGWIGFGSYDPEPVETDVVSVGTGGAEAPGPATSDGAPSVAWATPSDGATVSGIVTVQIDASDGEDSDDSLDVTYAIDGGSAQSATYNSTSGYYEAAWDTTTVSDGSHTLEAQATDSNGNVTTSSIGVTVDNPPSVETVGATNVTDTSATLVGDLTALEASDATVFFEFREQGASSWNVVGTQTVSSTGEFSTDHTGLSAGTGYEFRAVAETTDVDTGSTRSFTTDSGTGSAPSIDSFSLTDRSNPTWNWYDSNWSVSDPDGDLESVITQLRSDGVTVASESSDVSGSSAGFSHDVRSRGPVDEVRLLVTDQQNNTTSRSTSI